MEFCNSPLSASLLRLTLIQLSHKESLFVADGKLETDYLVIGGGATAMAFVDTLLDETDDRIVMVDRHDHPGGHWNDAYPFVRLHQPSAYYGVGSRELGRGVKYLSGPNAGGYELAS